MRHNDVKNMTAVPSCLRHFHNFDKIDSFPNFFFLNVCRIKKANCIFEELSNLYLISLLISFIPHLVWITEENKTNLKKLFIILLVNIVWENVVYTITFLVKFFLMLQSIRNKVMKHQCPYGSALVL